MLRKLLVTAVVCLISAGVSFAQTGSLSGTVTDAESGETLVGANVYIPELSKGSPTDANGQYEVTDIPAGTYDIRISYIGYTEKNQSVEITSGDNELNVELQSGMALSELVVTALGEQQTRNSVTFATQEVDADQLNVTQDSNVKTSLAGKVAGVQIVGQAGSKLGSSGDIRIRGAISLTSALSEPLYVVDGVPGVDPNIVDMNNIESVNVLKGPNATALYGQRGENGVVILQSKGAGDSGVSVELNNSFTYQDVAYLPNYQNEYGQGYNGEGEFYTYEFDPNRDPAYFEPMDGKTALANYWADESWGPKLGDGQTYAAWHNWFPDSPTYGQSTAWESQEGNVRDFFQDGITNKANFAVNYAQEDFTSRVSYSNLNQRGILPSSDLQKHFLSGKFNYDVTDAFNVGVNFNYTLQNVNGDVLSDGYSNQTTGTFNQWFGRQLSVKNMERFQDLTTPEGYQTNWNWFGPTSIFGAYGGNFSQNGLKKPAFWFNSYKWMDERYIGRDTDNFLLNVDMAYQLSDNWEVQANASRRTNDYQFREEVPFTFQQSSDQGGGLYNHFVNAFGQAKTERSENNYQARLNYKNNVGDWSFDAIAGSVFRDQAYSYFDARMDINNYQSGGLIIPNVYSFSNSREQLVPTESNWDKNVFSLLGRANVGYKDMIYINGSYRQDWSSALPTGNNGYGYPSVGASFVFTEMLDSDVLSYGKIRAGWAQVGSDVGAEEILGNYVLDSDPYNSPVNGNTIPLLYTDDTRIDPNIKPAINSSYEFGADLRFLNDMIGFSATYYNETREDEIIGVDLSSATGTSSFLTNAGSVERKGLELSLDATPVQNESFQWTTTLNVATNKTTVTALPQGLQTYTISNTSAAFGFVNITHELDKEWGQLRGAAIQRNDQGQIVYNNPAAGTFAVEQNHNYGSVLPDYTGGWINNLTYKGFGLLAAVDFQKGGQFFSLSEQWGTSGGLLEETAGLNDKGNPKRDPVSEGGGVHIVGVDADGNAVDNYAPAQGYYGQFIDNSVAEPYVIDADYLKLRELSLSYSLPKQWIGNFLNSARVSLIGRNLWMIAVSGENDHEWDPSELAQTYGENGQLPGTRSYGFNINVTF